MSTPNPVPSPTGQAPVREQILADPVMEQVRTLIRDLSARIDQAGYEAQAIRASLAFPDQIPGLARPHDLSRLEAAIAAARLHSGTYFRNASWMSLNQAYESAKAAVTALTDTRRIPGVVTNETSAVALIVALASRAIARAGADLAAYLRSTSQIDTQAWGAIDDLTVDAENLADQAAGYLPQDSVRPAHAATLRSEMRALTKAIKEHRPTAPFSTARAPVLEPDPNLPALLTAVHTMNETDAAPERNDLTELADGINEVVTAIRQHGEGWAADVRVHGWTQAVVIRAYELLARIARHGVRKLNEQGRGDSGRREVLATIHHYAEQHIERLRGTLPPEGRLRGFYDRTPDRYLDRLVNESRHITEALRGGEVAPEQRTQLQIQLLLTEAAITAYTTASESKTPAEGAHVAPTPRSLVAGAPPEPDPVTARRHLVRALRRRVDDDPDGRHAQTLNTAADRLEREITGNPELGPAAREAPLSADEVTATARHIASGSLASPLEVASNTELNLSYAQAERALAVLEILSVVGPINGLQPRTVKAATDQLPQLLDHLEERMPQLLTQTASAAAPVPPAENDLLAPFDRASAEISAFAQRIRSASTGRSQEGATAASPSSIRRPANGKAKEPHTQLVEGISPTSASPAP